MRLTQSALHGRWSDGEGGFRDPLLGPSNAACNDPDMRGSPARGAVRGVPVASARKSKHQFRTRPQFTPIPHTETQSALKSHPGLENALGRRWREGAGQLKGSSAR